MKIKIDKVLFLICLLVLIVLISCSQKDSDESRRVQVVTKSKANGLKGENRLALVIGNSKYKVGPLRNPIYDAQAISKKLEGLNFKVILEKNCSLQQMKKNILKFGKELKKRGGVGLFYFAGHGMQVKGKNYLIPIEANYESEEDVEILAIDVNMVLNRIANAKNRVNILILDACRNNPFARSFRSTSNGLAAVDAPGGTIIAYATAPGGVAADGIGENSIYTKYLLNNMDIPGLKIEDVFKNVRRGVMSETANRQVTWESSSLVGDFYFTVPKAASQTPALSHVSDSDSQANTSLELAFWESVKNSKNPEDFIAYLKKFPNGTFAELAKMRIKVLKQEKRKKETEKSKADNMAFTIATSIGTIDAYKEYLSKYPSGSHTNEALQQIEKLKTVNEINTKKKPEGLAGLKIDEIELEGILYKKGQYIGLFKGPQGKPYDAKVGDILYDGEIIKITANSVVFKRILTIGLGGKKEKIITKFLIP